MANHWTVGDLDPNCLFEVRISQDLETATRFSLPIPNWLNKKGEPLKALRNHPDIFFAEKKNEWRFKFSNFIDGCHQGVKIDGTGVILFMTPTIRQTELLLGIINETTSDLKKMTPDETQQILERSYDELGLLDRYNSSHSDLDNRMEATDNVSGYLGSFIYKDEISTAIYLHGQGVFKDGPAISDQTFDEGGFVVFPGKTLAEVQKKIKSYTPLRDIKYGSKIVGKAEFLKTRRSLERKPIKLSELPHQTAPKKRHHVPEPLPGFPEFPPEIHAVEKKWLRNISHVFAQYGFPEMKLRSVEPLQVLRGRNKENGSPVTRKIFSVKPDFQKANLALRYDLTVPLARYVAEKFPNLPTPFKSARIGRVWRGDKAAPGRFREFVQADVDVVGRETIPLEYDSEIIRIAADTMKSLDVGQIKIELSNRKILQGFFQSLGLDENLTTQAIRILNKRQRDGEEGVAEALMNELGFEYGLVEQCLNISRIKSEDGSFYDQAMALGGNSPLLQEGLDELSLVMNRLEDVDNVVADLSIARGLDYYTGTVIEGRFKDMPHLKPVLGGGRYDNLVGKFMSTAMPGVGVSIGITRMLALLGKEGKLQYGPETPTKILLAYKDEHELQQVESYAKALRERNIPCEILYGVDRKNQLDYAGKKDIPYVLFLTDNPENPTEIRDMREPDRESPAKQFPVTLQSWQPK